MRFTTVFSAGILNRAVVFLMIYLFPIIAKPAMKPPCKPVLRAELEKENIAKILKQYKHLNGENVFPLPLDFNQLHIHSESSDEKKMDAVCGVNYTQYALNAIYKHQQVLNHNKTAFLNHISETIQSLEVTLEQCLEKILNVTCKKHPKPKFPDTDHYNRKQWSLAALEHMDKFFDELIHFLQKNKSHPH